MLFFWILGGLFSVVGLVSGIRFLFYVAVGQGTGHVQSVVFTGMCITLAFLLFMLGFLADLMATNRRLLERIEWRIRRLGMASRPGQATESDSRNRQ
jgi:hypothetical protein